MVPKRLITDDAHEHLNNLTTETRSLENLMCTGGYASSKDTKIYNMGTSGLYRLIGKNKPAKKRWGAISFF